MALFQRIRKLRHRARAVRTLGAHVWSRVGLWWVFWYSLVAMKWGRKTIIPTRITLNYEGRTFSISFKHPVDIFILEEIFIDKEYELPMPQDLKTIVDLGGSIGLSAIYFALKYPKATVYVYEPDPTTFTELKRNTESFSSINIFNVMINDTNGPASFFISPTSVSSSKIDRKGVLTPVTVQGITFDSLVESLHVPQVDIVKFDIEGAEYDVFKKSEQLKNVQCFVGELHTDLIDATKEDFVKLFEPYFDVTVEPITNKRYTFFAKKKE